MFRTARDKSIFIMGYVLMPSHFHLIGGTTAGGDGISKYVHSLKGKGQGNSRGQGTSLAKQI